MIMLNGRLNSRLSFPALYEQFDSSIESNCFFCSAFRVLNNTAAIGVFLIKGIEVEAIGNFKIKSPRNYEWIDG